MVQDIWGSFSATATARSRPRFCIQTMTARSSIAVADLNGDGIDDLLMAGRGGSLFLSEPMAMVSPSLLDFGSVATGLRRRACRSR